jgi:plasmid maintenance system antidote protein VapI
MGSWWPEKGVGAIGWGIGDGVTCTTLSELVNGERGGLGISPGMAVRLAKVFGGSPESWLTQQTHFDLAHLRTTHIKLKRLLFA